MTKATMAAWFKAFVAATKPTAAMPILLLLDNHTSRFDVEFLDEAMKNHVRVLLLPPNLTHILQPADVGVFSSFKGRVNKACLQFTVNGGSIEKRTVASIVFPEWHACVSKSNILSGFRKTGVWPFNRLAVPDDKLSLESSVSAAPTKPIGAAIAQQQQELLATPLFGEFLSTPRLSEAKKDKGKNKIRQAIIVTGGTMADSLRKKAEAKEAKAAGVAERKTAREQKKLDGKSAKPAAAPKKPAPKKRKRADASEEEEEDEADSAGDGSGSDQDSSGWESEDGPLGRIRIGSCRCWCVCCVAHQFGCALRVQGGSSA